MCVGRNGDTTIHHQKQHGYCPKTYSPMPGFTDYVRKCYWATMSTGWFGPLGTVQHRVHGHLIPAPSTKRKYCGLSSEGVVGKTARQQAVQWSSGFDIGESNKIFKDVKAKVSFGSSSQTGYDSNAQMTFTFGHSGYLCGTNSHDPSKAAQLVMRGNLP